MTKRLISAIAVLLVIGGGVFALGSTDQDVQANGNGQLESSVVGLPPTLKNAVRQCDSSLREVCAGALSWTIASGEVELDGSGELELEVTGLLSGGTTRGIVKVRAHLTCEGQGVVATTSDVPFSVTGDAEIDETITLPSICVGPIVLVSIAENAFGPRPLPGRWIAATGF